MSETVVEVADLHKRYRLWHERHSSLKEFVLRRGRGAYEDFWAVQGVSFEVERGETFGIVGANGSGKSTLLKVLSGILLPDKGRVITRGRISALLELGAGFHPELTGRENVYLNGAILGIPRRQITERLDSIVSFAGLEEFIDSPIRSYSSGMSVRLGFSVAIHADPEVLLVDEVLAVGDEEFQRRSGERILQVRKSGTTIILVSHSLRQVRGLCNRAIWLDHGKVRSAGPTEAVVEAYLRSVSGGEPVTPEAGGASPHEWTRPEGTRRFGTSEARVTRVEAFGAREAEELRCGGPATIRLQYEADRRIENPVFGIGIYRSDGLHITGPNTRDAGFEIPVIEGPGVIDFVVDRLPVLPGTYLISVSITDSTLTNVYDMQDRMHFIEVRPGDVKESRGVVTFPHSWSSSVTTSAEGEGPRAFT